MKITKEEKKLFTEAHSKWVNEGSFLGKLFARAVKKGIEKDKSIQNAISSADKSLEKAQKQIEARFNGDKEAVKKAIPLNVRKYLGFDY